MISIGTFANATYRSIARTYRRTPRAHGATVPLKKGNVIAPFNTGHRDPVGSGDPISIDLLGVAGPGWCVTRLNGQERNHAHEQTALPASAFFRALGFGKQSGEIIRHHPATILVVP